MANMQLVRDEWITSDEARAAERAATIRASKVGPLNAEIVSRKTPAWHVLTTWPAHERIAMGHLIGRGLGCYLPEADKGSEIGGRVLQRRELMFPGYLFVFVWSFRAHWHRIMSCVGVHGVLASADGTPLRVPDDVVNVVRAVENAKQPLSIDIYDTTTRRERRLYNRHKAHRLAAPTPDPEEVEQQLNQVVGVHSLSLRDLEEAAERRLQALLAMMEKAQSTESLASMGESP